jgi:hypothetical protein
MNSLFEYTIYIYIPFLFINITAHKYAIINAITFVENFISGSVVLSRLKKYKKYSPQLCIKNVMNFKDHRRGIKKR